MFLRKWLLGREKGRQLQVKMLCLVNVLSIVLEKKEIGTPHSALKQAKGTFEVVKGKVSAYLF